jgi:hypothetical protein
MQCSQPGHTTLPSHPGIDQHLKICRASIVRPCPAILQLMPHNDDLLLLCALQESPAAEIPERVEHSLCVLPRISQLGMPAASIHHNSPSTRDVQASPCEQDDPVKILYLSRS